MEVMTIMGMNDIKYFFKKLFSRPQCFSNKIYYSLFLLGHKKALGTLWYPIALKLEDYLAF